MVTDEDEEETRDPKETAYDSLISPLMTQVIALCKEHKINMAAQFALDANDEGQPMYCTTCLHNADPTDSEGAERIRKLRSVMNPAPMFAAFTIISGEPKR